MSYNVADLLDASRRIREQLAHDDAVRRGIIVRAKHKPSRSKYEPHMGTKEWAKRRSFEHPNEP